MKSRAPRERPTARLQTGSFVLTTASVLDTHEIESRLRRFETCHHEYESAQARVEAARDERRPYENEVRKRDRALDDALEVIVWALFLDRRSHRRPLAGYARKPKCLLKRTPRFDKVYALRVVAERVGDDKNLSLASHTAAEQRDHAAGAMEYALLALARPAAALREARLQRDAIGRRWDESLGALKRGARGAADVGATDLYPLLFGLQARAAYRRVPVVAKGTFRSEKTGRQSGKEARVEARILSPGR